MKKNNKGFTMAEMLIVVAIIAVLIAIAIPTFGAQLKKAQFATDEANIRSKYAELVADAMMNNDGGSITISQGTLAGARTYSDTSLAINNTAGTITITKTGVDGSAVIKFDPSNVQIN
ncbi:MAG: prepilin-type N-terminal cleavage/methylation domain-containing protein [Ruminococcaceae bacterium]|nr:prepilin-type N-terminal cleavage/methylation domain-containing protein [Oscillospiraceae bacterium]